MQANSFKIALSGEVKFLETLGAAEEWEGRKALLRGAVAAVPE